MKSDANKEAPENQNKPTSEDYRKKSEFVLREEEAEIVRPTVERAILLSSQHDSRILARAAAPIIGPAIRRAFANIFKRSLLRLNRFFVLNFSADGVRWHFEAFRTGKPFRQVVQEHSMLCPVTQVFLIHRRTGLLIKQVQQKSSNLHDGDMISGMLTAIQDFIHDSFQEESRGRLEVIRIGEVTVLLEQGPLAILAGIISQGVTPYKLRKTFRRALEQIGDEFHDQLVNFKGDPSDFKGVDPILEACLKTRIIMGEDRISPMTGVFLLAVMTLLGVTAFFGWQSHMRWNKYLDALNKEPGITVIEAGRSWLHHFIRGLRDPMAPDPEGMLLDAGIVPGDVDSQWELYHSLSPELVLERVRHILKPPPGVRVSLRDGVVSIEGTAPWNWVERAPAKILGVCGVERVKTDAIRQSGVDQKLAWNQYLARIAELPGILVLKQGRGRNNFYISGMRDAMAPDPLVILKDSGLDTNSVVSHWEPFQALHPTLIIARTKQMLEPPDSVNMELNGSILKLSGSAPHSWINDARIVSRGIAGISRVDTSDLTDTDMQAFKSLIPVFDKYVFYYLANSRDLWPGQETKFRNFIESSRKFERIVRRVGGGYHINIRGHVLSTGNEEIDKKASEAIAERFYNKLRGQQLDMHLFSKSGMGGIPAEAAQTGERKRESHVSFKIVADD